MKKLSYLSLLLCSFVLTVFLPGCAKDTVETSYTYSIYEPVYRTTAEVRANIRSNAPRKVEHPGKLYKLGSYIFLNEIDRGIHVINNTNPAQPQVVAFVDVPGNVDLAVKGNMLYADLYTDLVAIDISDPRQVVLKKVVENVFPHRRYNNFYPDSNKVIVDWTRRDTTIYNKSDLKTWMEFNMDKAFISLANTSGPVPVRAGTASVASAPAGVSGSMARFTIMGNRLYTVGYSELRAFNIATAENPVQSAVRSLGWNIETIYPFSDKLFIGSQTGMFIYDVSSPDNPVQAGQFNHVRSCDPVIADNEYAYVTLRSGNVCQGFTNELDIVKLNNFVSPSLLKVYGLTNPHGLSKDGDLLFICDGAAGLKLFNAADVLNLQLLKTVGGIDTYDVIAENGTALVVAKDGLYQYSYANLNDIRLLSKLTIQ